MEGGRDNMDGFTDESIGGWMEFLFKHGALAKKKEQV